MPSIHDTLKFLPMLLLAAAAGSAAAQARQSAMTVYGGWRAGGSFTDVDTDAPLRVEDSAAGALSLDLPFDGNRQLQFYLAHQRTHLELGASGTSTAPSRLPLSITYLHVGGNVFFDGPVGRGPYVVGGIGATVFDPGEGAYATELRPSMNLGIGYQLPLGEAVSLRFEARGYATLVNSSGGFFCSGGCTVNIQGDLVTQGDVQIGLSVRF